MEVVVRQRVLACLSLWSLLACGEAREYAGDGELYQVALTSMTTPVIQSMDGAIYIVETHAELAIRVPTDAELAALRAGVSQYKGLPFPRLPWVKRGDLALQVDFSVSNLDSVSHDVDVIINGQNEFFEYVPTVAVVDEDPVPLHAQWENRYTVDAKSRVTHTVREEEFDEVAVDLATVVNGAPNSDEVVYYENKSDSDPRSMKYIPAVIPGLIGLRLGLRADTAAPILLEATVRVRDVGDKLAAPGDPHMQLNPKLFESVVPAN
jgi:hypothetical protein